MTGNSKQIQKAGDNSQLLQGGTINVYNGIDEKRAREIVDEKVCEALKEYSQEATEMARERVQIFVDDLIPKLVKENLMDSLKDPSIQILLLDAHKAAASTERKADYSLLSELLIHRIKKGIDRNIRSGVSYAIKIVDEISDEALLGLTVSHSLESFIPITGNINEGIKVLANLFEKIIYAKLPSGNFWLDHLDVLNAIRMSPWGSMKKFEQYYSEQLSGYVDVGIDKKSNSYQQAINILKKANLPGDILVDHELRDGYVRLKIQDVNRLDLVSIGAIAQLDFNANGKLISLPLQMKLSEQQRKAVQEVYELYDKDELLKKENINVLMQMCDKYDSLLTLRKWWNEIPGSFAITSVGKVLANANAQRCDPTVPDFN